MDKNTYYELLKITGGVTSDKWYMVMEVVGAIKKGHAVVESDKWGDSFKESRREYYPLELSDTSTWSTVEGYGCINLYFQSSEDNRIRLNAKIYNHSHFEGGRGDMVFEATILIDTDAFIGKISALIDNEIDRMAYLAHEKHLEEQQQAWIENYKKNLL